MFRNMTIREFIQTQKFTRLCLLTEDGAADLSYTQAKGLLEDKLDDRSANPCYSIAALLSNVILNGNIGPDGTAAFLTCDA